MLSGGSIVYAYRSTLTNCTAGLTYGNGEEQGLNKTNHVQLSYMHSSWDNKNICRSTVRR